MREWTLDRKSRQERPGASKKKTAISLRTYVDTHRKKLKGRDQYIKRLKKNLGKANTHLKTLKGRAHLRERNRTLQFISDTEGHIADLENGVHRDMTEFEEKVQPYIEMMQQLEEKRDQPKGSDPSTDEASIRDELAVELGDTTTPLFIMNEDMCQTCNVAMVVMASEARIGCPICSRTKPYMQSTSSRIPYGEEVEFASFSYKRQNHFQEWLNAIQAKENTEVPSTVIESVMENLYAQGIRDTEQITLEHVRGALKDLYMRKQYDHTMQIFVSITGKPPPRFSTFQEEQLRLMFDAIQGPFKKHQPPERKNFLSYSYCLNKFCQLLGYDQFLQYFMLLKGPEKLRKQDAIFKNICQELNWQFIPSCKERDVASDSTLEQFITKRGSG